jgi:hypothetical protein
VDQNQPGIEMLLSLGGALARLEAGGRPTSSDLVLVRRFLRSLGFAGVEFIELARRVVRAMESLAPLLDGAGPEAHLCRRSIPLAAAARNDGAPSGWRTAVGVPKVLRSDDDAGTTWL